MVKAQRQSLTMVLVSPLTRSPSQDQRTVMGGNRYYPPDLIHCHYQLGGGVHKRIATPP